MVDYPLKGGLQLTTVKPLVLPGTIRECLNFEVSTVDGYSRIAGVARFDGSETVGDYKVWRLKHAGSAQFAAGDVAWFDPALPGKVLAVAVQDGIHVVYLMVPGAQPSPSLPATLTSDTGSASILIREAIFTGVGTQETFNDGLSTIATAQSARISQVPGRTGSDIIGGFWLKDRLYAIRDLPRISFSGGYYTDADEGKFITIEGVDYRILDVRITSDQGGVLTYDTEPGNSPPVATPIGPATLADLPVVGDYGDGYTGVAYSDDLDVSGGVAPYTWELDGAAGTAIDPLEQPDANAINFLAQVSNAGLYRSGASGWQRVDLGREMQFMEGSAALENFARNSVLTEATVLDSGFVYPITATVNHVANANLAADDGAEGALAGTHTEYQATAFDFSGVPENATITGIEVEIERHSDTANAAVDAVVNLLGISGGSANKARRSVWPNVATVETFGGPTDLWGSQAISGATIQQTAFGARFIAERAASATPMIGGVDFIRMKVYYVEKDKPIYVWDGTTDVEMDLRHTQITGGATDTATATGFMNVDAAINNDKPRLVGYGDEIRTGPNGTGTLLAKVAERDHPIFLSGQVEIDNNRSRYQFERTNFYGQDEFEAVYGVSGAGPAFSFDGIRCIRIRTELPPSLDLPRHVCRHGDMLCLGYYPGAVVFSKPGDPHQMLATEGANALEVGDRLTALRPLAGDALAIICQSKTEMIRGNTPESMVKSPISAQRGGIEYTVVDMGRAVLCDGLGIFLADSPESFGAAERNYISTPVHPWLAPRLQAQSNSESAYLRPVAALNVRNKNQMRLYFWDGWCLTMTMTEPPQFTTQRYYTPAEDEHTEPLPWVPRMLASGVDSSGRERLFCSFYGGVKEGYVFEMDAGRSLDGDPIPAYVVMNPTTIESSSREKRYDRYHVYGSGFGWATLTASKSINDSDSFGTEKSINMGRGDTPAKTTSKPLRGVVDSPAEATDVSLRFESSSDKEGVFTLQYIEMTADDRGVNRGRQGDK